MFRKIRQLICGHNFDDWEEHKDSINGSKYRIRVYRTRICKKCELVEREPGYTANYANERVGELLINRYKELGVLDSYINGDLGSWYYCEFRTIASDIYDNKGEQAAIKYIDSVII